LNYKNKGIFILVKTSNPSSNDFQNLFSAKIQNVEGDQIEIKVDSIILERNYIHMAKLIQEWGASLKKVANFCNLGAVVGATYPKELKVIRKFLPNSFILIPGFGIQGAKPEDIKDGFFDNSLGGIVNSSRDIIYAYNKTKRYPSEKFAEASREEIIQMRERINKVIGF
ncbi:MAG: hypothetical protein ACFFKA_21275, partial [Candidatus Thorarchaeota archaeon]